MAQLVEAPGMLAGLSVRVRLPSYQFFGSSRPSHKSATTGFKPTTRPHVVHTSYSTKKQLRYVRHRYSTTEQPVIRVIKANVPTIVGMTRGFGVTAKTSRLLLVFAISTTDL